MDKLTHADEKGKARMVDVSGKPESVRTARAEGFIQLKKSTLELIKNNELKKGDVLLVARLAGIQAAKKTSDIIMMAHPLNISHADVTAHTEEKGIRVEASCRFTGKTGVEMEALTAVNVALLNIYDMCKAVDKDMVIQNIRLTDKQKNKARTGP